MMMQLTLSILLQSAVLTAGARDYSTAYQQALDTGRPLVVLLGADWCPGCQQMKGAAIPEVERKGGLSKVAFAQVNTDHQRELAGRLMQGSSIPQLIMYYKTEAGWKRRQLTGAHAVGDIQAFLDKAPDNSPVTKLGSSE